MQSSSSVTNLILIFLDDYFHSRVIGWFIECKKKKTFQEPDLMWHFSLSITKQRHTVRFSHLAWESKFSQENINLDSVCKLFLKMVSNQFSEYLPIIFPSVN